MKNTIIIMTLILISMISLETFSTPTLDDNFKETKMELESWMLNPFLDKPDVKIIYVDSFDEYDIIIEVFEWIESIFPKQFKEVEIIVEVRNEELELENWMTTLSDWSIREEKRIETNDSKMDSELELENWMMTPFKTGE